MRRVVLALGLVTAVILVGYATWLTGHRTPSATRSPSSRSPARAREHGRVDAQRPPAPPKAPIANTARRPPPEAARPKTKLGGGMDPDRRERAEQIYAEVMQELDTMRDPEPTRVAEVFLRGKAAIERMEDEVPDDDARGQAEVTRKLEALRERVRELTQ